MLRRAKATDEVVQLQQELAELKVTVTSQQLIISALSDRVAALESGCAAPAARRGSSHARESVDDGTRSLQACAPSSTLLWEKCRQQYGGGGDPCAICGRTVYAAERVVARGEVLHRECFRCAECDTRLVNSPNWEALDHRFFCGPHFYQRVQRGVHVERELSSGQVHEMILRKLDAAESALEHDRALCERRRSSSAGGAQAMAPT